jgi:hypothetical protein
MFTLKKGHIEPAQSISLPRLQIERALTLMIRLLDCNRRFIRKFGPQRREAVAVQRQAHWALPASLNSCQASLNTADFSILLFHLNDWYLQYKTFLHLLFTTVSQTSPDQPFHSLIRLISLHYGWVTSQTRHRWWWCLRKDLSVDVSLVDAGLRRDQLPEPQLCQVMCWLVLDSVFSKGTFPEVSISISPTLILKIMLVHKQDTLLMSLDYRSTSQPFSKTMLPMSKLMESMLSWLCGILLVKKITIDYDLFRIQILMSSWSALQLTLQIL